MRVMDGTDKATVSDLRYKVKDKVINWIFTLNINGHTETSIPTEICMKFLV